ncbi:MAG: alpha/beta fold hydrolase [Hyphomicrobiales bacterium]|uniref:alpha/beta hydrolase n=1 Tax=Rhabdaerophilum calidifontis TaxID=2604328 RepID=UPI00140E3A0A|nr:alpha/beta hydrolase [Rhabdaerophilum calidifontis]MCA1999933.1 alpha/beta fold hydrolase [Hyphomicrobiales bacterium]
MPHSDAAFPATASRFRLSRRAFFATLGLLPLGGCIGSTRSFNAHAGNTHAGAVPLAADPTLHVITTRRLAGNGRTAPFLDSTRAREARYLRARLEAPDGSVFGQINALVGGEFAVTRVEPVEGAGPQAAAEALRGRDTLLFVHGYNQSFEAASRDAAQLSNGIGFAGNTALFAWPSRGGLLDYGYDRESALLARDPLVALLAALLQDPFGARLHVVAHSMGTHLTLEALRVYRDRHGEKGLDRLGALVFAAPDIDADVFRAGLDQIGPWRGRLTVISATNDRALDLSRRLAGAARAGALPRAELESLGIRVIDATDFASGLVRHDAFVANADVRAAIRRAVERA